MDGDSSSPYTGYDSLGMAGCADCGASKAVTINGEPCLTQPPTLYHGCTDTMALTDPTIALL